MTVAEELRVKPVRPPQRELIALTVTQRDPERWANSDGLFWASVARAMKDNGFDTQFANGGYASLILPAAMIHTLPDHAPSWVRFSSEAAVCILVHPYQQSKYAWLNVKPVR